MHKKFEELTKDWPQERKLESERKSQELIQDIRENSIFAAIYETAAGMYETGVIDENELWDFAKYLGDIQDEDGLEELLSNMPEDYEPEEVDFGKPVGKEVW